MGIGSFSIPSSDSALQLAVLEEVTRLCGPCPVFYQEPRTSAGEMEYLRARDVTVLEPDDLESIPSPLLASVADSSEPHLVFMVHFDGFGLRNVFEAFRKVGRETQLIVVGNQIATDHETLFGPRILAMKRCSLSFSSDYFRRAFADTCIYFFK